MGSHLWCGKKYYFLTILECNPKSSSLGKHCVFIIPNKEIPPTGLGSPRPTYENYRLQWFECAVPENVDSPPTEQIGISWGVGDSLRPKHLYKCIKLIEISRVVGEGSGLEKSLSVGEE